MKASLPILLMDDDCVDALLFKRVLQELGDSHPLIHKINGGEALAYLRSPDNEGVGLIITDLHAPEMDGLELLQCLKADEQLCQIPVIILTGSEDEEATARAFRLGAAAFMVKPPDRLGLTEMVQKILDYWTLSESPIIQRTAV